MKFAIHCCVLILGLGLGSDGYAQSGSKTEAAKPGVLNSSFGLPKLGELNQRASQPATQSRWPKLPSLFGATKEADATPRAGNLFDSMPKLDLSETKFPKPTQLGDQSGGGLLGGLPKLFGGSKPAASNGPNVLDQFNSKSKQMIDRTTNWARNKQKSLREKTLGGLSGLAATPEAPPAARPDTKPNYYAAPTTPKSSAQPPIRTAANPDQPTMRF